MVRAIYHCFGQFGNVIAIDFGSCNNISSVPNNAYCTRHSAISLYYTLLAEDILTLAFKEELLTRPLFTASPVLERALAWLIYHSIYSTTWGIGMIYLPQHIQHYMGHWHDLSTTAYTALHGVDRTYLPHRIQNWGNFHMTTLPHIILWWEIDMPFIHRCYNSDLTLALLKVFRRSMTIIFPFEEVGKFVFK